MKKRDMRGVMARLTVENQRTARQFNVVHNAAKTEATVYLYDVIDDYWGVSAAEFVKEINGISAGTIHLRINSPGGDVFAAQAMQTALRNHSAKVIAYVDGLAASAATHVALAADEVRMSEGSFFMIHKAWTFAMGNANDIRETADLLDKIDSQLQANYAKKTGASAEQIEEWVAAETWFTAQEALDAGFIDAIDGAAKVEDSARWNVSAFANAPKALTEKPAESPIIQRPDAEVMNRRLRVYELR